MTTGFQLQNANFGPILKTAAKPQHLGSRLKPASDQAAVATPEKRSFTEARVSR